MVSFASHPTDMIDLTALHTAEGCFGMWQVQLTVSQRALMQQRYHWLSWLSQVAPYFTQILRLSQ